jgi:4-amino-4-deoxy-L-arabinose transferase-like glycosyltransferase
VLTRWTTPGWRTGAGILSHRSPLLALGLVLLVLVPVWRQAKLVPLGSYDQDFYLGIAYDLLESGRYTDGFAYAVPLPSGERPPGMRFAPLYPVMVAAASLLEPGLRAAGACVVNTYPNYEACQNAATLVRGTQFLMLAAVYLMVWWLGGVLIGSWRGAWMALAIALITAPYLMRSVDLVMTEITTLFLSSAATAAGVAALQRPHRLRWGVAAGVLLGLGALTRPAFLYLFYAVVVASFCLAAVAAARRRWRAGLLLGVFVAGFAVPVGPWVLRNAIVLHRAGLSFGYASHTLVQRISFDAMTPREYALSYLCGLPDGFGIANQLVGRGSCDRFALDDKPGTFYQIGTGPLLTQTLEASGGYENHLSYLLHTYIFKEPLKHALVTIPMALRGAWVDHDWGLVLGLVCIGMTVTAVRRRETGFLVLALPAWFMLLFNAAVAVNQVRYNLMLIPPYAVAGAMVVERILRTRRGGGGGLRRRMAQGLIRPT